MAQVTLIDQIGGTELKAKLADVATTAISATSAQAATADEDGNNIKATYYKIPSDGTPIVGVASPASLGGYAAPTNAMVVNAMPASADIIPTMFYFVKEST